MFLSINYVKTKETTIIRSLALIFCIHMSSQNPTTTTSVHIEKLADEFDGKTAQEVLKWALDTFGTKIALASSFGAEDVVIIDMMANLDKNKANVFTLDTGRLNQETYDVMDAIRARYWIPIEVYFPDQK